MSNAANNQVTAAIGEIPGFSRWAHRQPLHIHLGGYPPREGQYPSGSHPAHLSCRSQHRPCRSCTLDMSSTAPVPHDTKCLHTVGSPVYSCSTWQRWSVASLDGRLTDATLECIIEQTSQTKGNGHAACQSKHLWHALLHFPDVIRHDRQLGCFSRAFTLGEGCQKFLVRILQYSNALPTVSD